MTEKERMLSGKLYSANDSELKADSKKSRMLTRLFNNTTEEQKDYRVKLLKELFEKTGENIYIEPPFRCDYGSNISIGNNVVIGSGSVVTRDIPDNVIAVGNPCRVLREITKEDKLYWEKEKAKYYNNL